MSTSSSKAIEIVDDIVMKYDDQAVRRFWDYGYELDQGEMHRWNGGVLHSYWCIIPEEYKKVKSLMDRVRKDIESHPKIACVEVEPYTADEIILGTEMQGEKWAINFAEQVEYDHQIK